MPSPESNDGSFTLEVPYQFSWKRVSDLLCCALEGAATTGTSSRRRPLRPRSRSTASSRERRSRSSSSTWTTPINPGGSIVVSDAGVFEDGDEDQTRFRVDRPALVDGLKVMAQRYPHHFKNWCTENEDAETGDVFLQCVIFKEVRYG